MEISYIPELSDPATELWAAEIVCKIWTALPQGDMVLVAELSSTANAAAAAAQAHVESDEILADNALPELAPNPELAAADGGAALVDDAAETVHRSRANAFGLPVELDTAQRLPVELDTVQRLPVELPSHAAVAGRAEACAALYDLDAQNAVARVDAEHAADHRSIGSSRPTQTLLHAIELTAHETAV